MKTRRSALPAAALLLCAVAGCASFGGGARGADRLRTTHEPGWIQAGPTPEVRQDQDTDCGPAVLAMVLGRWGVQMDLARAAREVPPSGPRGVKLGQLRDAARAWGLEAFAVRGDRALLIDELRAGRPVVVGLHLPRGRGEALSHFEVVVAIHPDRDEVATLDPAAGWRLRPFGELDQAWQNAGRPALVVLGAGSAGIRHPSH